MFYINYFETKFYIILKNKINNQKYSSKFLSESNKKSSTLINSKKSTMCSHQVCNEQLH